jgi:hypothetical protein
MQRVLPFIALRRVEIKYGGITGAAEVMEIRRAEREEGYSQAAPPPPNLSIAPLFL